MTIRVVVSGAEVEVPPGPTIGATATGARWLAGCGEVPFDNWEIRDEHGTLLDPSAGLGSVRVLYVNRHAGIGG